VLKDAIAIYSEVTMAKDAPQEAAAEIAVPREESGLEGAKETFEQSREKGRGAAPDSKKWSQGRICPPRAIRPMPEAAQGTGRHGRRVREQQKICFDEWNDANAKHHESMEQGVAGTRPDGRSRT